MATRRRCASASRSNVAERNVAEAGLFSSWASPAESLPSANIFAVRSSIRADSRVRSVISETSFCARFGARYTSSRNSVAGMVAIRVRPTAMPRPPTTFMRENGSTPVGCPAIRTKVGA